MADGGDEHARASQHDPAFVLRVERYLSGVASADEVALLNQELIASPQNRDLFVQFTSVSGYLVEHFGRSRAFAEIESELSALEAGDRAASGSLQKTSAVAPAAEAGSARPASPILGFLGGALHLAPGNLTPKLLALAIAAALGSYFVGALIMVAVDHGRHTVGAREKPLAELPPGAVGSMRAEGAARWADGSTLEPRQLLAALAGKQYKLSQGRIEATLKLGTRVVIEGPAVWKFSSDQRLHLSAGQLVALVPPAAVGFAVKTDRVEIVDLGTEFGVSVGEQGEVDVVVYRGEVELRPDGHAPTELKPAAPLPTGPVRLKAGQARRITREGVASIPASLVRGGPLARSLASLKPHPQADNPGTALPRAAEPASSTAAGNEFLINGGFEQPSLLDMQPHAPGSSTREGYESTLASGWELKDSLVINCERVDKQNVAAAQGGQFLVLNSQSSAGSASQELHTVAGQEYEVTFAHNQFYSGSETDERQQPTRVTLLATVVGSGQTLYSNTFDYERGELIHGFATDPGPWPTRNFRFRALGKRCTLTFTNQTPSHFNFGQAIDDVRVRAVEPAKPE